MERVTIIGSGSLGSLLAALLEPYGPLAMLSHWPEQIEAIRTNGLICSHEGNRETRHFFPITDHVRELDPIKLALILVKSYQTARAAYEIAPVLAPDGFVVTLQNGLGNFEMLEAVLGRGRVVQGVTAQGATLIEPGFVKHAGHGLTAIALTPGKINEIRDVVKLFNVAGLPAETTDSVRSLQWGKLAINAGINPLTAILGVRNGYLLENRTTANLMCAVAEETAAVAAKAGIALPYPSASRRVTEVAQATADNTSSMLQDVLRGAPTEIDAINGAVSSHGRELGVSTPLNDELWRLVREIQVSPTRELLTEEKLSILTQLDEMIQ